MVLRDPHLLGLALLLIGIASIGKLGGCYFGSRLARMNHAEALAVGFAMNARGSTEFILATIGLTMGLLNQTLFTIIVLMAVVTTLCMPPLLRWALARVPMREEEKARMETEAAEEKDLLPKVKRILVTLDASASASQASSLAGWLVGARRLTATVVDVRSVAGTDETPSWQSQVLEAAETSARAVEPPDHPPTASDSGKGSSIASAIKDPRAALSSVRDLISFLPWKAASAGVENSPADAILAEAKNGYDLLFLGLHSETKNGRVDFPVGFEKIIRGFPGPVAVLLNPAGRAAASHPPLDKILVPMTGTDYSRFGAEVAVAIAKGCGAAITALHVSVPPSETDLLRRAKQLLRPSRALLAEIVALGQRAAVRVLTKVLIRSAKEHAILREANVGKHDLIVIGTKAWSGEALHFGQSAETLIANARCPVLLLKS